MASFPTDTFVGKGGDLDVFIPAKWGAKINDFVKEKLQVAAFFTNRSEELADGGDTVYTPGLTEMVSATKSNGAAVTLNSPTETRITLVVNTWNEVSFAVEDREAAIWKKSYYLQERYAKNAGYTAGLTLENAIVALFTSFTDSVGASTTAMLDSDIRKALGIFEVNTKTEATADSAVFIVDTKVFWNQIAGNTTYQLNINSPVADPVTKRPMPMLYGVPVKLSNLIAYVASTTGRINVLAHKDAIHFATAKLPGQTGDTVRVQSNYIPQYLSTVTTADLMYGVILNRATFGVKLLTSAA